MRETAVEAAKHREDEPLKVALEEEPTKAERHVGGEIPPVRAGAEDAGPKATASEQAFDNADPVSHNVKSMVSQLFVNRFDGDAKKAFEHYDRDQDQALSESELTRLLADAGVGKDANTIARNVIGTDELMMDFDAAVSWDNFERAFSD